MRPLIWAHRGASGYAPENTLPAFAAAADMKADGVELDIQLTKDGEIVVIHDESIDRTSNLKGMVGSFNLAELKKLDFSNGNLAFEGTEIPAMQEVFELLRPTDLTINIEIKTGIVFYRGIEEKILDMTKAYGMEDRVIYSSFNHYSVLKIKELNPDARTGFLYMDGPIDMPGYAARYGADALHPALYNLQFPNFMEDCRERGIDVNVWTVDAEEHFLACAGAGVHAVITNYPEKAVKVYRKMQER